MTETNWKQILLGFPNAKVLRANPHFGSPSPWLYESYLLLAFPNDVRLEVQWDDDADKYLVSVTRNRYCTLIAQQHYEDSTATIDGVRELAITANFNSQFGDVVQPSAAQSAPEQPPISWLSRFRIKRRSGSVGERRESQRDDSTFDLQYAH